MAVTESLNFLETSPPRFTAEEVAAIAADLFDLRGEVRDLRSERDQTFLVGEGVLKISNTGEDPAILDLEAKALAHIERVDPELPIARQLGSGTREGHLVRLFERMPGRPGARDLDDDAVSAFAETNARLTLALRGFFHPAAGRPSLEPGASGAPPPARRPRTQAGDRSSTAFSTATKSAFFRAGTISPRRSRTATSRSTTCWSTSAGASPGSPTSAT